MGNGISLNCGPTFNLSPNVNLGEEIGNILCPRRAAEKLELEMCLLRATKCRVEKKIIRHIRNETTEEVWNWRAAVLRRDAKVTWILGHLKLKENGSSSRLRGGLCCCICFGCDVKKELELVTRLRSEGERWEDDKFMENIPFQHDYVLPERLHGSKIIVGIEETMSQVFKCLKDDEVEVIGIHGMGGVGKTTLINQVIRRLRSSSSSAAAEEEEEEEEEPIIKFESIISVVVSQNVDVRKIQEDIAIELGLSENEKFKDQDERIRARFLSAQLSERKFLLVLDDMWKPVDLKRIGIPYHYHRLGNKCKVILTTRKASVCAIMGANRRSTLRVGCLRVEDSWELFQKTIGWDTNQFKSRGLYEIAREIARKCSGLPLVLLTVARAMSTKETRQEWEDAKKSLEDSPHVIGDMEDVYRLLEFSFNNLTNEEYKSYLLYSALYREDELIRIDEMVDYCIAGGSIVGADSSSSSRRDIDCLRRYGRTIISGLIGVCLLERVEGDEEKFVKVHDAIRDMIVKWLGEGDTEQPNRRILSLAGEGLEEVFNIDEILRRDASMVSLKFNDIGEVVVDHENLIKGCNSNMQVLLLNWNRKLKKLPRSLFEYFPNLCVLDLSHTGLEEIPASLCSLKSLQYLNLSNTGIEALPKEMCNLTNLMQLDLSLTLSLCEIPSGVLSSLSKLQSMNLFWCGFFSFRRRVGKEKLGFFRRRVAKEKLKVLKEVDGLPLLKDVSLSFEEDPDVVKFIVDESNMLSKSTITKLHISGVDLISHGLFQRIGSRSKKLEFLRIDSFLGDELVIDEGHFMQLTALYINYANSLQRIIILNKRQVREQLTLLFISDCSTLWDLACLWQLPNLKTLFITDCCRIVEVVPLQPGGDGDESHEINYHHEPFPKLQHISLCHMPRLKRISSSPLSLHSLIRLKIEDCPFLKKLSIMPSNSQNVKIDCKKEWWEGLKWEDGSPLLNFKPNFTET